MKQKIKNALINRYKKLGYSHKAIDAVASHLEKSVTKEEDIDEAVEGVEDLLSVFQSEIDSRVTKALKDKEESGKEEEPKKEEGGTPAKGKEKEEPAKGTEEVPAYIKTMMETLQGLSAKVSSIEAGKATDSRKKTLENKLESANPVFKNATLKAFSRMKFDTDEEFEEYLAEIEADMGESEESEAQENLSVVGKPQKPSGKKTKEASKEEIASVVNEIMP